MIVEAILVHPVILVTISVLLTFLVWYFFYKRRISVLEDELVHYRNWLQKEDVDLSSARHIAQDFKIKGYTFVRIDPDNVILRR